MGCLTEREGEVKRAANESTKSFTKADHRSQSKLIKATGMVGLKLPDRQRFPEQPCDGDFKVTFPDR